MTDQMTQKQREVIRALELRPAYWITEPSDLVEATGMSERGILTVLYHLSDKSLAYYDEYGWHLYGRFSPIKVAATQEP